MNFFCVLLSLLFVVGLGISDSSAADSAVTVEAAGEAAGSDLESPREVCERAKAEAQRAAIEQAVGTFINSHTLVTNGQLADDLIFARVRGAIERLEVIRQERGSAAHSCRMLIKATVSPAYPSEQVGLSIKAALSRSSVKDGDEITITSQVNLDSHLYLFVIAADNSVTQLLPNGEITANAMQAGKPYVFPPDDSSIRLKVALLPQYKKTGAEEKVKIIATRNPEPLLEKGFREGFAVYDSNSTGLVSDLLRRLNQLDPADWGEATLVYGIAPKALP